MGKVSPAINALNAGEWSPLLEGRSDLEGYFASCRSLKNTIPLIQGPGEKRAGTVYVAGVKANGDDTILMPFIRSRSIAYVIEFGDEYCRFYTNRGQLLDGGNPYEIVSPYPASALKNSRGEVLLDYAQDGDVIYITHRDGTYAPRTLSRTATDTFAFATLQPDDGPFQPLNSTSTTLYVSAKTGSVTITASANTFNADMVGQLVRIEEEEIVASLPFTPDKSDYSLNEYIRSDGKEYQVTTAAGDSGTEAPTHTSGTVRATSGGNQFKFVTANYGIARITAYTSATEVTATVLTEFPNTIVGSSNASTFWRMGLWGDDNGYPETVSFYQERLTFGQGRRVDMSTTSNFESFAVDEFGEVIATSAVSVELQSGQTNDITGFAPADNLLVFTEGAEFQIGPITASEAFGPDNVRAVPRGAYGSRFQKPIVVGDTVLHMNASGTKLRELRYDIQTDALASRDMAVRSEHLLRESPVTEAVRQEDPKELIWQRRQDGGGLLFTYDQTQSTRAWAPIELGGTAAEIKALAVIPSPDGLRDDVWLIASRTIDESTVQYVEYFAAEYETGDDIESAVYVDSAFIYDGSATATISGLDHLEGETVAVLGDGAVFPDATVSGGEITLSLSVSKAVIGLAYEQEIETFNMDVGARDGTAFGKKKKVRDCAIRFLNTRGGQIGVDAASLKRIPETNDRDPATLMGSPSPLFSGDVVMSLRGGYSTEARILYRNSAPYPSTVILFAPQVETHEDR